LRRALFVNLENGARVICALVAEIKTERALVEANRKLAEIFEKKIQQSTISDLKECMATQHNRMV